MRRKKDKLPKKFNVELHIIDLPFFTLSKKKTKTKLQFQYGDRVFRVINPPGLMAKKLFMAICRKMSEDLKNEGEVLLPVEFSSSRELRKVLGNISMNKLREIAYELAGASYVQENIIEDKEKLNKVTEELYKA